MSKPFDATMKDLGAARPADFAATFDGPPTLPAVALNVDLSTVTTAGDLVVGLGELLKEILHFDFQAGPDAKKGIDVSAYNLLLHRRFDVPVHSVLLLLRSEAKHKNVNGKVAYAARVGRGKMDCEYEVVPLWERPAEELLTGPLGTSPLAVLGQLPAGTELPDGLRDVVERLVVRLDAEAEEGDRKRLLASAYVLSGLRVERPLADKVFQGVKAMRESTTYMGILEEGIEKGRLEGVEKGRLEVVEKACRPAILNIGQKLHGKATAATRKKLNAISDAARLERILNRVADAKSWADLLATS